MLRTLCAVALALALPGLAAAKPKQLESVPLGFTPTTVIGEMDPVDLTGTLRTKIELGRFIDFRTNPNRVAENREDEAKGRILPVTTRDDVAAWVKTHLGETLGRFGLNVVSGEGDVVISGEIRRFFVTETSTYQADLGILVTVKDRDGKELWQGMANGAAERFGRSFKLENYQESWSDALLEAAHSLLSNPGFRAALAKAAPAP